MYSGAFEKILNYQYMENINFVAVDFETATPDKMACQIGIVVVKNGRITEKYSRLIQPPKNEYSWHTIKVHHITPEDTGVCDTFDVVWNDISKYFQANTIVAHNANFDESVLYKNLEYYNISSDGIGNFICTYNIYGIGLSDLCAEFGIDSSGHHDALFDAECCAKFYLNHLNNVGQKKHFEESMIVDNGYYHEKICGDVLKKDLTEANPENPFYDKKIVVTGLFNQERASLASRLKSMGADIDTSITKRTNIVLIGKDPGPKKIEKIEKLSIEGYEIIKLYQTDLDNIFDKY